MDSLTTLAEFEAEIGDSTNPELWRLLNEQSNRHIGTLDTTTLALVGLAVVASVTEYSGQYRQQIADELRENDESTLQEVRQFALNVCNFIAGLIHAQELTELD